MSKRVFATAAALTVLAFVAERRAPGQQVTGVPSIGPQPTPPPAPCPLSNTQMNDAMVLVIRIGDIVSQATERTSAVESARKTENDQPARIKVRGGSVNTVPITRDKLDEIRAEVEQLKTILGTR
jgi:hypothetical protein